MTKKLFLVVLFFSVIACSGRPADEQASADPSTPPGIKLKLEASPRQGFGPLHVSLTARLEGVAENDQRYYCMQEEWDFGDGAKSSEKPNCEPFGPDTKIKTEFFSDRTYDDEGAYTIRFVLGEEGKERIRSRPITVNVLVRGQN